MNKPLFMALASVLSITACTSNGSVPPSHGPQGDQNQRSEMSDERAQAMHECAASTGITMTNKDTRPSRSDMQKIDACMSEKGFEKPTGKGKGHPPA